MIGGVGDAEYRSGFEQVLEWSSLLDPADGVMIDISPGARGANSLGTNDGVGLERNPKDGIPYAPNVVPAGDYYRVLAEFWADGPDSETPPGHWFALANTVSDHPHVLKKIEGVGPPVGDHEWDVKLYLALGGAVHDAAISAWGVKGWYDYVRPVSAVRYLADQGQRSDPTGPSYDPNGIALEAGRVEVVSAESILPGERHAHLAGVGNANVGKIAVYAWRGPDFITDPATSTAGVGWILAENWWPYQRPTFVTPPFAGYVSGHSTFSRAAAEVMTLFTGDAYFPDGLGSFEAPQNEFLVFEEGPSVDVTLQWATYRDASDESSISRIYGGIHPPADDFPGRRMGAVIGPDAFRHAKEYFGPSKTLDIRSLSISKRGLVHAFGRMELGKEDDENVLDLSQGLSASLKGESGEVVDFEYTACSQWGSATYFCRNPERGAGALLRPFTDDEGEWAQFAVFGRTDANAPMPAGMLNMTIRSGETERMGVPEDCWEQNGRTSCR